MGVSSTADDSVLRLGAMHTLMSFVGSVGALMGNSALEEVLKAAFGGVTRMLTGRISLRTQELFEW